DKFRSSEVGPEEKCEAEIRFGEVCHNEVCSTEIGSAQIGSSQVRTIEEDSTEVGSAEKSPAEIDTAEVGHMQFGLAQVRSCEVNDFVWMLFSPRIPGLHPLSEKIKLLLVCHMIALPSLACCAAPSAVSRTENLLSIILQRSR